LKKGNRKEIGGDGLRLIEIGGDWGKQSRILDSFGGIASFKQNINKFIA